VQKNIHSHLHWNDSKYPVVKIPRIEGSLSTDIMSNLENNIPSQSRVYKCMSNIEGCHNIGGKFDKKISKLDLSPCFLMEFAQYFGTKLRTTHIDEKCIPIGLID